MPPLYFKASELVPLWWLYYSSYAVRNDNSWRHKSKINNGTDEFDPFIVFILHNTHTHKTHTLFHVISLIFLSSKKQKIYMYATILFTRAPLWVILFFENKNSILILKWCQTGSISVTLQPKSWTSTSLIILLFL